MPTFNLVDQPWIPCVDTSGKRKQVGLEEVIVDAGGLREIEGNNPLEVPALLRLIEAILYRAIGVATEAEWLELWTNGKFPSDKVKDYFNRHRDGFDLFGPRPFYQIPGLVMKGKSGLSRLAHELSTGNNATLFDHNVDDVLLEVDFAAAARMLVVGQAFALGFGKASTAQIDGEEVLRPYLADGAALRGFTLWLHGNNLFETCMLNLVPSLRAAEDTVPWESTKPMEKTDRVVGKKRIVHKVSSVADLYTMQSRFIRLLPDEDGRVRMMYFTQGRSLDKDKPFNDPMKVYVQSKEEGIYPLGLRADKAAWRDLHTFFQVGSLRNKIIEFIAQLIEDDILPRETRFSVNLSGLATDPGKAGKFLLWRQEHYSIPAKIIQNPDLVSTMGMAIRAAEEVAVDLRNRLRMVVKDFIRPEGEAESTSVKKDVNTVIDSLNPTNQYWARLEGKFAGFLNRLPTDGDAALSDWYRQVETQAGCSFHEICHLLGESPRVWRAIARHSDKFTADLSLRQEKKDARKKRSRKEGTGK
ncbi:type I-E CRISPR-associated protein Cse1/CasA [Heliobacterium undosum]|uniref:Type I-E CRISPR-associated protein Cse1/CasA n=1 Tax=Heliomicrobium undosum TaxID=121734 RepID=A0A845L3T3_9FIRM|nr:type I-E CRISPR-associated protein Cse1/CasA [Heliomicrobium undosum]MZP30366.1 type I-E CRISPR-associated protein Cse1/CasA [Heliomicrobium undosum]